jgi:hypothetical protein
MMVAGCGASHHATAPELRALRHAGAEIPFLRDFPRAPGTTHCEIHPGGVQPLGTVFPGSCTTRILARSPGGRMRVVFSETYNGPDPVTHTGRFTATLSPTGHVIKIEATGQTPQTWK